LRSPSPASRISRISIRRLKAGHPGVPNPVPAREKLVSPPIRIFLLHRYRLLLEALIRTLRRYRRVSVVGFTSDCAEAVRELRARDVDLVLVDADPDRSRLIPMIRELKEALPSLRVLALGVDGEREILECVEAGASGYVPREASLEKLLEIIRMVHHGAALCPPEVAASVFARMAELSREERDLSSRAAPPDPHLTPREREVLRLIAKGLRNKEIAQQLGIALSTVKNHVHVVLEKLRARHRREAIRQAYEMGFLEDPYAH